MRLANTQCCGTATLVVWSLFLLNIVYGQQTLDFSKCCNTSQDATAFSLGYGAPLRSYVQFTKNLLSGISGANQVINQPILSTPDQRFVVKPNVDTLYSVIFIDLSSKDVVVTVPPITDGRFWDFPFYDPFGNQFATMSITTSDQPGDYLIRRADDVGVEPGLVRTPVTRDSIPKYNGIINYPTTHGLLLVRILVRQNTTEDLQTVNKYQEGIKITPVNRTISNPFMPRAPELTPDLLDVTQYDTPEEQTLQLLARLGPFNQPSVPSDRYRVASILGQAGIVNGAYQPPSNDIDLTAAQRAANDSITAYVRDPDNIIFLSNGWLIQNPDIQGNFNTTYTNRAYVASIGYLELNPTEALYPTNLDNVAGPQTLGPDQALLFTFEGGRPPIQSQGFWSLTVYGGDNFLIENPLGRYEIGDRSNATFPDGKPVYTGPPGVNSGADQGDGRDGMPFQVLLQPQDVMPPDNWTSNWLPGPRGGGDVVYTLRWYAPTDAFVDGTYVYPKVEKVDAIKAS